MPDEFLAEHFANRELVEREMSQRAADPRAAAAHVEMADHYEALAMVFGAKPPASAPTVS